MKHNPFRSAFQRLTDRLRLTGTAIHDRYSFGDGEAIRPDFATPSIPYYEKISKFLGLVRIVLYAVLLLFTVTVLTAGRDTMTYDNLYYLVKDIDAQSTVQISEAERLYINSDLSYSAVTPFRGGLVVSTGNQVYVQSSSGKNTFSMDVTYGTPDICASKNYFVAYGIGDRGYSFCNAYMCIRNCVTEFPVYAAACSDNGCYVIATRSNDYMSDVLIYDKNSRLIATSHNNGYVTSVCISHDGSCVAFLSVSARGDSYQTDLKTVRIQHTPTQYSRTFSADGSATCHFIADDRIAIIFDDRLVILRPDTSVQSELPFGTLRPMIYSTAYGTVGILFSDGNTSDTYTLIRYERSGRTAFERHFTDKPYVSECEYVPGISASSEMVFCDDRLFIHTPLCLLCVSGDVKNSFQVPLNDTVKTILSDDSDVLWEVRTGYADRVSPDGMEERAGKE